MTTKMQKTSLWLFISYTVFACIGAASSLFLTTRASNYNSDLSIVLDVVYVIALISFAGFFYKTCRRDSISDKTRIVLLIMLSLCALISIPLYGNISGLYQFIQAVSGSRFISDVYCGEFNFFSYAIPFVIRYTVFAFAFFSLIKDKYKDAAGKTAVYLACLYFFQELYTQVSKMLATINPKEKEIHFLTILAIFATFALFVLFALIRNRNKILLIIAITVSLLVIADEVLSVISVINSFPKFLNVGFFDAVEPQLIINGGLLIFAAAILVIADSIKALIKSDKKA